MRIFELLGEDHGPDTNGLPCFTLVAVETAQEF
jgi:hypothetical protein